MKFFLFACSLSIFASMARMKTSIVARKVVQRSFGELSARRPGWQPYKRRGFKFIRGRLLFTDFRLIFHEFNDGNEKSIFYNLRVIVSFI